jgi:hypothetical protein
MEKNRQGSEASQAFVNRASAQVAADKQADAMKEAAVITATATREVAERQIRIAEAAARAAKMAAWAAVAAALGAIGQVIVAIAK